MKLASNSRGDGMSGAAKDATRVEMDGVSRRQVLARSAVAAGVVWAAPVIKTASAYALTAAGTERPCTQFYVAGLTLDGNYFPPYPYDFSPPKQNNIASRSLSNGDSGNGDSGNGDSGSTKTIVPPLIATWGRDNRTVPVLEPDVYPQITQTGANGWAVLLPEVTGPNAGGRQPRFIAGYSYQDTQFAYGFVDPNPANPQLKGRRLLFPSPVGNDQESEDVILGGSRRGLRSSTSTASTSSTTTSSTTPRSMTTTTMPSPGTTTSTSTTTTTSPDGSTTTTTTTSPDGTTTTTTMPSPGTTTSTSTSTTSSTSSTTTTLPTATTTTSPDSGTSTTTTTSPESSTSTTTTTSPDGTTTTSNDPWSTWLAAGGLDTRGGGSGGDGRTHESDGGGDSAPKLSPLIDTAVGVGGSAGAEVTAAPERARTRRFADLFGSVDDQRPVLTAPISGVVIIYCQP